MVLVKAGKPVEDLWTHVENGDALPEGPVTISWARWQTDRDNIAKPSAELGVRIPNTVTTAEIGAEADRFGMIVVNFPNFGDGRAFSQARVLRSQYGYKGEIRATGGVLRDQLQFMVRCGIDAFEVPERAMTEGWFEAALGEFDLFYQPAEDNRPWIQRQRRGAN
jgi:uncharacterized protein (DUF934 family)